MSCKFGIDTCSGITGTSYFVCRDCIEDAEWEKEKSAARLPRSQTIHLRAANEAEPEGIEGTGEYGDE